MVLTEIMEYRYRALVLRKREVGETDRIYTFFTREAGKITALAKGVRKSEAKLASALETGSEADVTVVRTRGMGKIAGAILENSYAAIRENFNSLRLVVNALDVFDKLVEPDEPDEVLFEILIQYLVTMELFSQKQEFERMRLIDLGFFFQMVFHLGYTLQLYHCSVSGEKLIPGQKYVLSPSQGGVVSMKYASQIKDGIIVDAETIKTLRIFGRHKLLLMAKLIVGPKTLIEIEMFRSLLLRWIRR